MPTPSLSAVNLSALLNVASLKNVTVDAALFNLYADEFNALGGLPGNAAAVVRAGDANGDGSVDLDDLNHVRNYFGLVALQAVPEPAADVLTCVAVASIGLAVRPRRGRSRANENQMEGVRTDYIPFQRSFST